MRTPLLLLLLLASAGCVGASFLPDVYYFVTTDHTHAQVQLDERHPSYWNFSPDVDFLFGGGKFIMKEGSSISPSTTSTLEVWELGPSLIGSRLLSAVQFQSLHPGNDQSFGNLPVPYILINPSTQEPSPIPFYTDHTYQIKLVSNAPDVASQQYFIKDPRTAGFYTDGGAKIPSQPPVEYMGPPLIPEVPEPSSWLLLTGGVGLLAVSRTCRRRR